MTVDDFTARLFPGVEPRSRSDAWLRGALAAEDEGHRRRTLGVSLKLFGDDPATIETANRVIAEDRAAQAEAEAAAAARRRPTTIDQGARGSDLVPMTADQWLRPILEGALVERDTAGLGMLAAYLSR